MRHEKIITRDNGDTVKIVTMITANVFVKEGYEVEQFALVKELGSEDWTSYYTQVSPKSMSREEYITKHKPKTFLGMVSIGESIKAGIEAKEQFFSK